MNNLSLSRMTQRALLGLVLALGFTGGLRAQVSVDSVLATNLLEPVGVAATSDGALYVSDGANYRVVRFSPASAEFRVLAGLTGVEGSSEGANTRARFKQLEGIVLDPVRGGLVVADSGNQLIRFVSFDGVVTNLAGRVGQPGAEDGPKGVARLRYPLGLAADTNGNIFIADSKNNAIRKLDRDGVLSTLSTNFFEPAAVTVGANGELWVADTRNHAIKRLAPDGTVTLVAGSGAGAMGYVDALLAPDALFNSPRGLLWLGATTGLLISDGGNNVIRRLFLNPELGEYSVETFAGVAGPGGFLNGPVKTALFSAPVALCSDLVNGGVLVADRANRQIRRISTGPTQPPVEAPKIGWVQLVKDAFGAYVTTLVEVENSIFNNAVVIAILAEAGTQTYFTYGASPVGFDDSIPSPGPLVGLSPPFYQNGRPASEMPSSILEPQPDMTIKAIGTQDGRRSSPVVQARFQFKVGNPSILGDNAAMFTLENVTQGAEMWYTLDGSDPTNNPAANPASQGPVFDAQVLSLVVKESNVVFKACGYKPFFKPSDIVSKVFTPSNFVANAISFGFEAGEASSDYVGSAGQRFYAPVTLNVLSGVKLYSLQFNVTVNGAGVDGSKVDFQSMLYKPVNQNLYMRIPPAMATNVYVNHTLNTNWSWDQKQDLLFRDTNYNLLGVGWLERYTYTNLYNTLAQDLITYSMAHDTLFESGNGKVILGGYSFVIPTNPVGNFQIEIARPSGTADGVSREIFIDTPTNDALKSLSVRRTVRVGEKRYLVGDVTPFRWFNAGDFGNSNLLNNDVLQTFQSAVYEINMPPEGSDFFDAMDSCCGGESSSLASDALFDGNDTSINSIVHGDGDLNVADVFVTFRRSLDPSLTWVARYWSGGQRRYAFVNNQTTGPGGVPLGSSSLHSPKSAPLSAVRPWAVFHADDIVAGASRTVSVPVRVRIAGDYPLRVLLLNLTVQPLDGSPALTQPVSFSPASALGAPTVSSSRSAGNFAAAWLDNTVPGLSGAGLVGMLTVTLPEGTTPAAAYRVHFDRVSGSPNGLAVFPSQTLDGLITLSDRSVSSWNDGIPDSWRLRHFGSTALALSAAELDPDLDGISNREEFRAGTNPMDRASRLRLLSSAWRANNQAGVLLQWPTGLNRRYVIESSSAFGAGAWQPIATNILGSGAMGEFVDPSPSAGARFYRVRVVE